MMIECPICTYKDHEDYFTGFYGEIECPNCGWMEREE